MYNSNVPLMLEVSLFGWYQPNVGLNPEVIDSLIYNLDGGPDIAIMFTYPVAYGPNTPIIVSDVLSGLNEGKHLLAIHGLTSYNTTFSANTTFTVDMDAELSDNNAPRISILSPENTTYGSQEAHLTALSFWVNKPFAWARFSLDNQENKTINGNTTLYECAIGIGPHSISVYTIDTAGYVASDTIRFSIVFSTSNGRFTLLSPQNQTYTNKVMLSFIKNEAIMWTTYTIDDQPPVLVYENTTLPQLSEGSHSIVVQFLDSSGLKGSSETVYFTITEAYPTTLVIAASITSVTIVGVGLVIFRKKRKRENNPVP